ncbi:MAG: Lrp/AsnC family transcriptional regulator [Armatimonadota bacterium]|nr:Lrp/AsnC family transcriptional regulator [Armatimonadota bacterium]
MVHPVPAAQLDELDRRLLDRLQRDIPLQSRLFEGVGVALEISEAEVLARVGRLKQQGLIRQISAIFDSRRLGYHSCLAAARVQPHRLEAAAQTINRHPGVSHNYQRDHAFNLWFTLTVPPQRNLRQEAERLQAEAGVECLRLLPALKVFKIGVHLPMGDAEEPPREEATPGVGVEGDLPPLDAGDIQAIRALQQDVPLVPFPFRVLGEAYALDEGELLRRAARLRAQGRMRRFAAVLRHRQAGFVANGMGVWNVPEARVEEVGTRMAAWPSVSHCYQRPRYPDWPYTLFTMIHARSREECEQTAREISRQTNVRNYALLYSVREFKKARVRYFEW